MMKEYEFSYVLGKRVLVRTFKQLKGDDRKRALEIAEVLLARMDKADENFTKSIHKLGILDIEEQEKFIDTQTSIREGRKPTKYKD